MIQKIGPEDVIAVFIAKSNRCLLHCDVVTRHLNVYSKISICGYIKLTVAVFNSVSVFLAYHVLLLCGCV